MVTRMLSAIVAALLLGTVFVSSEERVIGVKVNRNVFISGMPKTDFTVSWEIARHEDNRKYTVSYDCESIYREIREEMKGDNEPLKFPRWSFNVKNAGSRCTFRACVYRIKDLDKPFKCVSDYALGQTGR